MTTPGSVPGVAVGRFVWMPTPVGCRQLRETEVEDLDVAVGGDEEVFGLEVAVNDALFVGGRESVGDRDRILHRAAGRELAARERGPQRLALEQLLDDVRRSVPRPFRCRRQP